MTSLPITSSNPQSPAKGTSTTPSSGMPDAPTIESFGMLLAQQMEEAGTAPPSAIAPSPAIAIGTEATADSAKLTGKFDPAKSLATTDITVDPASVLAIMLQPPREIQTPAINDAAGSTTTAIHPEAASKAAGHQPAVIIDATRAQTKFDMAMADNQSGLSASSLEIANSAMSINGLPRTSPATQNATPSITAAAVMANAPAGNRPADAVQTIATSLGHSGWAGEFSQKINWISTQQNQVAELHLNPPDLGPLNVVLKISDNHATALFTSPHSAVRDAVENALPKLRETLADNGITLGNTTVSDQAPRDRDMEKFMSQGSGTAVQRDWPSEENLLSAAAPVVSARRHNGMVDIFA